MRREDAPSSEDDRFDEMDENDETLREWSMIRRLEDHAVGSAGEKWGREDGIDECYCGRGKEEEVELDFWSEG